jgi:hypothetical protein
MAIHGDNLRITLNGQPSAECGARREGYPCTRPAGHEGPHQAIGVVLRWENSAAAAVEAQEGDKSVMAAVRRLLHTEAVTGIDAYDIDRSSQRPVPPSPPRRRRKTMATCNCMGCPHPVNCRCRCETCRESLAPTAPVGDIDRPVSVADSLDRIRSLVQSEAGRIAYLDDELNWLVEVAQAEAVQALRPSSPPAPEPCVCTTPWACADSGCRQRPPAPPAEGLTMVGRRAAFAEARDKVLDWVYPRHPAREVCDEIAQWLSAQVNALPAEPAGVTELERRAEAAEQRAVHIRAETWMEAAKLCDAKIRECLAQTPDRRDKGERGHGYPPYWLKLLQADMEQRAAVTLPDAPEAEIAAYRQLQPTAPDARPTDGRGWCRCGHSATLCDTCAMLLSQQPSATEDA